MKNKMKVDWNRVKRQTLWSYEDLIRKLTQTLTYDFVEKYYNYTMKQAQGYAKKIRRGYLQDKGNVAIYIDEIIVNLEELAPLRVGTWSHLVNQVATREQCLAFLQKTNFDFDRLIQTLNYLLRWVLPFPTPLREIVDIDNATQVKYLTALKAQNLGSNIDLLEVGRTKTGRTRLANATGIPITFLTALVHKADISRLAYVRGKTVQHLCGGGYDTLEKIAAADLAEMEQKMDAYYRTLGKSITNFKSVVPLVWMIGGARTLPRVVK
jgi:hypothetical protein